MANNLPSLKDMTASYLVNNDPEYFLLAYQKYREILSFAKETALIDEQDEKDNIKIQREKAKQAFEEAIKSKYPINSDLVDLLILHLALLVRKLLDTNYVLFLQASKKHEEALKAGDDEAAALQVFLDSLPDLKSLTPQNEKDEFLLIDLKKIISQIAKYVFLPEATSYLLYQKKMEEDNESANNICYSYLHRGLKFFLTHLEEDIKKASLKINSQNYVYLELAAIKYYLEKNFEKVILKILKNNSKHSSWLLFRTFLIAVYGKNLVLMGKIWDAIIIFPPNQVNSQLEEMSDYDKKNYFLWECLVAAFKISVKNGNFEFMEWIWQRSGQDSRNSIFTYMFKNFLSNNFTDSPYKDFLYKAFSSLKLKNKVNCQIICDNSRKFFRSFLPSSAKDVSQLLEEFLVEIAACHRDWLSSNSEFNIFRAYPHLLTGPLTEIFEQYKQHYDNPSMHQTLLENCIRIAKLNLPSKVGFHSAIPKEDKKDDNNLNYKERILQLDLEVPLSAKQSDLDQNIKAIVNDLTKLILKYIYTEGSKMLEQLELAKVANLSLSVEPKQESVSFRNVMT